MFQRAATFNSCRHLVRLVSTSTRLCSASIAENLKPVHKVPPNEDLISYEDLLRPYTHIHTVPGKNTRPRLMAAFNHWLKVPSDKMTIIEDVAEILHNHVILLDDLQDNTLLRRGVPVAQAIYGVGSTLNACNYVMLVALEKCQQLGHPQASSQCIAELINMHRGLGTELFWRDNVKCPTEEEFNKMTILKDASMFKVPFRVMQLFSDNKQNYDDVLNAYALYVQVKDDYTDVLSEDRLEYKHFCEDIGEGKFPFPIIHAIHQEGNGDLIYLVRQKPQDMEIKKYVMSLLKKHGSLEYTRLALCKYEQQLRDEIKKHGGNPSFDDILTDYEYLTKKL